MINVDTLDYILLLSHEEMLECLLFPRALHRLFKYVIKVKLELRGILLDISLRICVTKSFQELKSPDSVIAHLEIIEDSL